MKKSTIYIVMAMLCLFLNVKAQVKTITIKGRITNEKGFPISNATIKVKESKTLTVANGEGLFELNNIQLGTNIIISSIGFKPSEIHNIQTDEFLNVHMFTEDKGLEEVQIVSTGYQNIPKERATGSFVLIDSGLLNRKVSSNLLDRLDGVTSGLIFNKNKLSSNTSDISIRGRSTISSNTNPLIILDNFPYDGDLANINPQDVKSITVLKDAAASSIWGSRAGNGVIVITTFNGTYNKKPVISLNSNISIGDKPDLYYRPQLTNQQFIGIEQFLFDKGAYNSIINNGYGALSPAVEIMLRNRTGAITSAQRTTMLDSIASFDNRKDLSEYYYRKSVNQQYQLSVNGGGQNNKYYISLGYDKNLANTVINNNDRLTLNVNNTTNLINNRLELYTGVLFSSTSNNINGQGYQPRYPYERIADQNRNALAVTDGILRLPYIATAGNGKLLDWQYRPLDEIQNAYSYENVKGTDYRINLGINYKIIPDLKFSVNYTYNKGIIDDQLNRTLASYYTRNQINTFTQISPTGVISYPFPLGNILNSFSSTYFSNYGRGQLGYDKSFNKKHVISALAGFEIKDYQSSISRVNLYGYDEGTATNKNGTINPTVLYPYFYGASSAMINQGNSNSGTTDRYRSFYANASYTFDNRFILSASARRDESNLFGVNTNQKGVPLWSGGFSWNISNEKFYKSSLIPYLKLRATFGYNGNINKSVSAYLTAMSFAGYINGFAQQYLEIQNPPNPSLKWERVKNLNLGVDFASKNSTITGSVEYWIKDGLDLIGATPIAPQTGITVFTGNSADMHGQGIDLILNSRNIARKDFAWTSNFLFNYNTDKITSYKVKATKNSDIVGLNYIQPIEGYSYYSVFTYKWMGLDNQGKPQSILNGNASKDYVAMTNSKNTDDLLYSGTLRPKYFGSLINTIKLKDLEFSFNLVYKLGYVYRRSSLSSTSLYSNPSGLNAYQQFDYDLRWQNPGDELKTDVPALIYPIDGTANNIYNYSSILIEKADHIRLQDIRLNYILSKKKVNFLPFSNVNLYCLVSNLGVIWRESKYKIDPDYPNGVPLPRTYAVGLKLNF